MISSKDTVFFAPHPDDEILFGSFTLMRERPLVVIVTDSFIQWERGEKITAEERRAETQAAMDRLGLEVEFLGIRDDQLNKTNLLQALAIASDRVKNSKVVFSPMLEGEIPAHDLVGETIHECYGGSTYYSTYTKDRPYPEGDIAVIPTPEERKLKNELLEYYTSQKNHPANKIYFQYAREKNEYFNSSLYYTLPVSLKEHALRNLTETKQIFDGLGVPFWLMDGLLLGAVREGDFIENDEDDLDIGFPEQLRDKVPLILKEFEQRHFKFVKQFDIDGQFEGATVDRNGSHMDFFIIHKRDNIAFNTARNALGGDSKYMAYVYPRECFEDFDRIIFKGMKFSIPSNVGLFLSKRYNEDWETPCHRGAGFSWLNLEQNKCLTTEFEV